MEDKENTVRYYIGDPCYMMKDMYYDKFWASTDYASSETWENYKNYNSGKKLVSVPKIFNDRFVVTDTQIGDGCYEVKYLNLPVKEHSLISAGCLPVDAGCLSIIEESLWKEEYKENLDNMDFGIVIQLPGCASNYELGFKGWRHENDDGYREYIIKDINTHKIVFRVAVDTNGFLFTQDEDNN